MEKQTDLTLSVNTSSTKKLSNKTTLPGVLNGLLTFILILMAIATIMLIIGFIAIMINPQLETFNSYDDFRLLYEFSPLNLEQSFKVVESNPSLSNPEVKLFGSVNFQMGNRSFVMLFFFFYLVILACFVNILVQLRNFLGTFENGNPFIKENVKRIRIVGWSVILFPFWGIIYMLSFAPYFKNIILSQSVPATFYWKSFIEYGKDSFWIIFFGLVVLVIAESFRLASQIKEEQELTI